MGEIREEAMPTVPPACLEGPYDGDLLVAWLCAAIDAQGFDSSARPGLRRACQALRAALDRCAGDTTQERWTAFETHIWPAWVCGRDRPPDCGAHWTGGPRAAIMARLVRPSWAVLSGIHLLKWVAHLPEDDPLRQQRRLLGQAIDGLPWVTTTLQRDHAAALGLRLVVARGYRSAAEITERDLLDVPAGTPGGDILDAALCALGIFARTPERGARRRARRERLSPAELVARSDIAAPFRAVTTLYLETYAARIGPTYRTMRQKQIALAHFWRFLRERYPDVRACADVRPAHARAFIPYIIARGRETRRGPVKDDSQTAHARLIDVRVFFSDLCGWATEPDSPFAPYAPPTIPLVHRDLIGVGFEEARKRTRARLTATVLDLEHEMPTIRAHALRRWDMAATALGADPDAPGAGAAEREAFWDWALLELLVQSGLRIEEASELTTLDVLKRSLPDGRVYYLLHVKPSKYDRARVIPIGDGLGRVIAEIIRHVKRFYGTDHVPPCDHMDLHEKRRLPRAPYLLQGATQHPSPIGIQTIRARLGRLSRAAGARTADGSPLTLLPHDCRRVFASEHLNNNTPVHVIQALLGHATVDTVMVYAKLYPTHLVEAYRTAVRGLYGTFYGAEELRNPTAAEWAAFTASCTMRDMGTHLCALPTGEYCPKGLVCLGCVHAQPKQSAIPVFRRMLGSHERALGNARVHGEPPGQVAAREMEIVRIRHALGRAEELTADVAAAIEEAAVGPS